MTPNFVIIKENVMDIKKIIDNHQRASTHHMEAAGYHQEAAKCYTEGDFEKAAHNAVLAWEHHALAGECINNDARHYIQVLSQINY